jgi:hypothetical protein
MKYQNLPLQDIPKFTQIGIFGLQMYHLATLRVSLFLIDKEICLSSRVTRLDVFLAGCAVLYFGQFGETLRTQFLSFFFFTAKVMC